MAGSSSAHIIQSLLANTVIAASKGVAAVITGSGALLAETIHSSADCGNQLLLLLGVKQARRPADPRHPLGYGRALYFWSFMVAMLLFTGGGMFSIYEGIHKIRHPEEVGNILVGVVVLLIALALEGWATVGNIVELNKRRGNIGFFRFLRETKDSDLVVVFGENAAAVLGLALALAALAIAKSTGDGRWDGGGSLAVGVVLVGVAVFLAIEIKSLLVGESADPAIEQQVRELAEADPYVQEVLQLVTVQQGPGEIVVAMKVRFTSGLTSGGEVEQVINAFEDRLRAARPEARWCFIEPDLTP
jgi:cation diffusion facilitator family transporter